MKTLAWYGTCIIYKWMNFDFLSIRLNSRMCLLYSEITLSPIRIEAKWKRDEHLFFVKSVGNPRLDAYLLPAVDCLFP